MLVDALEQTYALAELLAALGLARISYFYHRARLLVADRHADARRVIADVFELNHRCYGYRRIRAALIRQQVFISFNPSAGTRPDKGTIARFSFPEQSCINFPSLVFPSPSARSSKYWQSSEPTLACFSLNRQRSCWSMAARPFR